MASAASAWRAAMLAALSVSSPAPCSGDAGYKVAQSVAVARGSLQILEDERLDPGLAGQLWGAAGEPGLIVGDDSPAGRAFAKKPLRPARLRQVDRYGRTLRDTVMETQAPLARIEGRRLGDPSAPILLVTTDDSAGAGSYSGQVTRLYALDHGRVQPVQATAHGGRVEIVAFINTLKSGWKIVGARPDHIVIEQLLCRPDFDHEAPGKDEPFLLSYITYWTDGGPWRMARRVTPGFWENEGDWPPPSAFPKPSFN
jgi:hypothetical protein